MNDFTIYRNYGVLGAEKRNIYTYGTPHVRGVCNNELKSSYLMIVIGSYLRIILVRL